jgi:hypothetical protein
MEKNGDEKLKHKNNGSDVYISPSIPVEWENR